MPLLKEMYELWRGDSSLTKALNDSYHMLEHTREMFEESIKSLRENDKGDFAFDIYEKDQVVNRYILDVRKKVLKYLAITGGNIIPGLILTSIVIDIERIGDYTKNITDLAIAHPKKLKCGKFENDYRRIETTLIKVFNELVPIFKNTDKEGANKIINDNYWSIKKCDEIVVELIKEKQEISCRNAVTCALYTRYLKRVGAHLFNIASSIVNPFELIGFKTHIEEL